MFKETKKEFNRTFVRCFIKTVWDKDFVPAFIARSQQDADVVHILYDDFLVSIHTKDIQVVAYPLKDGV